MPPFGLSALASEYSMGMSVLGEGAMVKLLTNLAIANFTSINANLIPGHKMQVNFHTFMS
jgi:hypothetical protein